MSKYVNLVNPSKSNFDGAVALSDSALSLVNCYATLNGISVSDVELCSVAIPVPYTMDNGRVNISIDELKLPSLVCYCEGLLLKKEIVYGGAFMNFFKVLQLSEDFFFYNGWFISSGNSVPISVLINGVEHYFTGNDGVRVLVGPVADGYSVLLRYENRSPCILDNIPLYLSETGVVCGKIGADYYPLTNIDGECSLSSYTTLLNKTYVLNSYQPDNELMEVFLYCRSKLL